MSVRGERRGPATTLTSTPLSLLLSVQRAALQARTSLSSNQFHMSATTSVR
jgi:hypothetical protein